MALTAGTAQTADLQGFDEFVRRTMEDWTVPGLAIAVARDGQIIYAQGFGQRNVAQTLAVTPRTLFAIGSASKAFTTMSLGLLADDGTLDWDTPLRTYLPAFQLHDPVASERMTPRDLVTHRSGLPRHDLMWYNTAATRRELIDRLRYLEPSQDFRAVWQYQNLMYLTAGYLVEQLTGRSWEEVVRARIFAPLGMDASNLSVADSQQTADVALPYKEDAGTAVEIPFRTIDTVGPAGSINSSIEDMSRWLLLHLNRGMHGQTRLVSEGQIEQMHSPQMVMAQGVGLTTKYREAPHASYGLGWFVQPYRGYNFIHHGGNIDGFSALVSFMPQENLGVVVLSNRNGNPVPMILSLNVYDRLLGLDEVPWNERYKADDTEIKAAGEKGKEKSASDAVPNTQPSHPLEAYAGEYAHPGYGVMTVHVDGDALKATFNNLDFALTHYHYDVFELVYELFEMRMKVVFSTNVKGDIAGLAVPLESTVADIVFKRLPPRDLTDRGFLERFVGEYELMGMNLTVALKGETTLLISLPGQPDFDLVPYKGMEFEVKGLSGFRVEFKSDAGGAVIAAELTQPGGVLTATRK